jgi:hypothetical protein
MTTRFTLHRLALALALALTSLPTAAQLEESDALYQKGNEAYTAKRWRDAYEAYSKAFALKQSYDIAGNLGDVELILGKHRDAAEHLSLSLRLWPTLRLEQKKRTAERLEEAKKSVGAAKVTVDADGAEITVNGRVVGKSPLSDVVWVEPGPIVVEAKLGDRFAKRTVAFAAGEKKDVVLHLATAATAPLPNPGGPTTSPVGTERERPPTGPGAAKVDRTWLQRRDWTPAIVGGALTAAALGAFVVFKVREGGARDDQAATRDDLAKKGGSSACSGSKPPSACSDLADAVEREASAHDSATIALIAAGALAAGTITAFLLWPERKPPARSQRPAGTTLGLVPIHSGAFLSVGASF